MPPNLTNCLLILPEHCGRRTAKRHVGEIRRAKGSISVQSSINITQPAFGLFCLLARSTPRPKNHRVVFNRQVGDKCIVIVKEKQIKRRQTELLSEHNDAVRQAAREFAEKAGLQPDIVDAIEQAGSFHDVGKANPLWQLAADGGSIKYPVAKTCILYRRPGSRGFDMSLNPWIMLTSNWPNI